MKKSISFLLCVVMVASLFAVTAFAQGGLSYFQKSQTYRDGKFADVSSNDWFYINVKAAYEYGLIKGQTETKFGATENVRISEVVALAARLRSIYMTGSTEFAATTPWYQSYVDYAVANDIIGIGEYKDYNAYATRYQFADILGAALPSAALAVINDITTGDIPDVTIEDTYSCVYKLYRAGIITGKTGLGEFCPNDYILRSEVAAIVTRMANADMRVKFTIQKAGSTAGARLLTAVGAAREEVQLALDYYNEAYLKMTNSNYTAAASAMNKATTHAQMATQYLKSAAETSKANSLYSGVYAGLNSSYTKCSTAINNIAALTATSYSLTADWNSARTQLTDCSAALMSAYVTIRDLG